MAEFLCRRGTPGLGQGGGEGRPRSPPLVQAYFITRNSQGPNEAIHGP